jgi:hypothetical protein
MDPSRKQLMKPIPIAQYLNRFERADPTPVETPAVRTNPFLKPRPAPPAENLEARLAEAFERGRQEGLATARAETAEAIARVRAEWREKEDAEQTALQVSHGGDLADRIADGLDQIEQRIAATVARILKPYLAEEQSKRVILSLSESLGRILNSDSDALLRISGPEAVLSALRDRLSGRPVRVEYNIEDGVDVTVEADQTIIESQLAAWFALFESIGD